MNRVKESVDQCLRKELLDNAENRANQPAHASQEDLSEKLVAACVDALKQDSLENPEQFPEVCSLFLQVARYVDEVAAILRNCGYSPVKKFESCSLAKACRLTFFYFTTFIAEMDTFLKVGNRQSIEKAAPDRWKEVLAAETNFLQLDRLSLVDELLAKDDALDAMATVSEWKRDLQTVTDNLQKLSNRKKSIMCGRPCHGDDDRTLAQVRKALLQMKKDGDAMAVKALDELKKQPSAETVCQDSEETGGKKPKPKKKRGVLKAVAKKDPYKRQKGDELRLSRKREIVACWWRKWISYTANARNKDSIVVCVVCCLFPFFCYTLSIL